MKTFYFAVVASQVFAAVGASIPTKSEIKREKNWNEAAWSNFINSYVDDWKAGKVDKRDKNWNEAAWSNFINSYVNDWKAGKVDKRDKDWNEAAWSNFINSYVDDWKAGKAHD